jgi:GNAT superfamily N-acetyltransferase
MTFVSEGLAPNHVTSAFDCGKPALDEWLKQSALHAQANRTARTFVWHRELQVVAFFSLAATVARREEVPKRVSRGSPEVIPAVLLARLALDRSLHGSGYGGHLLVDASRRVVTATEHVGARLLVVDAIDEGAVRFYERYGFTRIPGQLRLAQKIGDLAAAVEGVH